MDHLITVCLREKGGRYYAVFYDPDRGQKWRTLRTASRREAERRIAIVDGLVSRGEIDPWVSALPEPYVTLQASAKRYMAEREKSQLSRSTLRADRSLLRAFCARVHPSAKVKAVTPDKVSLFFDHLIQQGRADNTLRTYHTRLTHFFGWCKQERLIRNSPMDPIPKPKAGDVLPRFLSHDEFDTLIDTIYSDAEEKAKGIVDGEPSKHTRIKEGEIIWLAEVCFVAVETGMRRAEICEMEWSWVDFSGRSIWIPTNKNTWSDKGAFGPKSGKGRRVPFGAGSATEDVLTRLRNADGGGTGYVFKGRKNRQEAHLDGTYLSKRFREYRIRAGQSPEYTFHTLRHTCASWMVIAGRHLVEVKEMLGHASIDTTVKWYAHLDPSRLNAAADATFGGNAARLRAARARIRE